MPLLMEPLLVLRDFGVALVDLAIGPRRRRYETSIFIGAAPNVVWRVLRSRDITFEGFLQMRHIREPLDDGSGLERNTLRVGHREVRVMLRLVEERPLMALQYEFIAHGSAPELVAGDGDYTTLVLHDRRGGTQLDIQRELTPTRRFASLLVPLGLRSGARRYKAKAERMAIEQERTA